LLLQVCRYLLDATKSGDVDTAKILFKCSNDSCTDDNYNRDTPLICAAFYGHVEVVRVLLEGGAIVDRANIAGFTALYVATEHGNLDVCRLLLDWGAKVDRLNTDRDTPLHNAAQWGSLSVAKLLVERGADVSVRNANGQTASDWARNRGHKDVADWLDSVRRG
jgi:ankyrin repeat protein